MAGMTNDYNESCGGIEEAVFRLETTQTFNVTVTVDPLSSWGAALAVRSGGCTAPEIACKTGAANTPVSVTFAASAGTSYFIFPARFTGAIGNYTLTVQ